MTSASRQAFSYIECRCAHLDGAKQLLTSFNQALQEPCSSRVRYIGLQNVRHLPCICMSRWRCGTQDSVHKKRNQTTDENRHSEDAAITGLDKVATKRHVPWSSLRCNMRRGNQKDIHSVIAPIAPRQSLNVVNDRALVYFWCQPRGPPGPDWLLAALASHTIVRGTLCGVVPTRRDDHYSSMTTYDVAGIDARRR
jgi:hypothetical protein